MAKKAKVSRNFKKPKKTSGVKGTSKGDKSCLDTKLDSDRLFYEFRKLLLKKEMPDEKEEWFDPKLVQAIRTADTHTGSGYVLAHQLTDIVSDWILEQSGGFQTQFLVKHVTNFVIERFLNRYPKVDMDLLLIDPAVARLNQIIDKYKEGVDSKLVILPKEASLREIVPVVKDPRNTVIALDFDQTITLVEKKKIHTMDKIRKTMTIRGGEETKLALEHLVEQGAKCCIVTAQTPSVEIMVSLVQEIRHLQLSKVFGVEPFDPSPIAKLINSWGPNEKMSLDKLTTKLVVLISLNTDREPSDMERIGFSMLHFEDREEVNSNTDGAPKKRYPCVGFRLFGNPELNPSLKENWTAKHVLKGMPYSETTEGDDGSKESLTAANDAKNSNILPTPRPLSRQNSLEISGDISMCTVRCMKAYYERTKSLREQFLKSVDAPEIPKVFIEDTIREREKQKALKIAKGDFSDLPPPDETEEERKAREARDDMVRYAEEELRQKQEEAKNHWSNRLLLRPDGKGILDAKTIDKMTKDVLREAKIPEERWSEALGHPVEIIDLPGNKVQYSRYGNCMAARYNKPEAVIDFINKERPQTRHCVFVDDNSDNCFNMFAHFANLERLGEPLLPPDENEVFRRNHTTPVTVFWYTPLKKSEVYNVQARQLIFELARIAEEKEKNKKGSDTKVVAPSN